MKNKSNNITLFTLLSMIKLPFLSSKIFHITRRQAALKVEHVKLLNHDENGSLLKNTLPIRLALRGFVFHAGCSVGRVGLRTDASDGIQSLSEGQLLCRSGVLDHIGITQSVDLMPLISLERTANVYVK